MNKSSLKGKLEHNYPLASLTSWRVGGHSKQVYWPSSQDDLSVFLSQLPPHESLLWLGLGSNTLIRDGGFAGTVIITQGTLHNLEMMTAQTLYAAAGVPCAKIAKVSAAQGLTGGEFFAGIPGTIGGALCMNAGAFGGETWTSVVKVDMINRQGQVIQRNSSEFNIAYRHVVAPPDEWYVGAYLQLQVDSTGQARNTIRQLLRQRNAKQPIGVFSCGSVFRNPAKDYAGRLIEAAGLKGYRIGGAQVSPKHANFIVNTDRALATDIEALIAYIQQVVLDHSGILLQPEVKIVGQAHA